MFSKVLTGSEHFVTKLSFKPFNFEPHDNLKYNSIKIAPM